MSGEILLIASDVLPAREFLYLPVRSVTEDRLLFEELPAGRYTAKASSHGRPVGQVEADVVAGQRTKATLTLESPSSDLVPLEGLLVLPEERECEDSILHVNLRGRFDNGLDPLDPKITIRRSEMRLEEGSRGRFRWSADHVPAGLYRVFLLCSPPYEAELDTGPFGTREALIEVPTPAHVSLRCVDERTGVEVESEKLSYAALTPRVFREWHLATSPAGSSAIPWEFFVPPGEVLIFTTPNRYEQATRIVKVGPGMNEVVLRLRARIDDPVEPERR
jgi:hypothetical protein